MKCKEISEPECLSRFVKSLNSHTSAAYALPNHPRVTGWYRYREAGMKGGICIARVVSEEGAKTVRVVATG